MSTLSQILVEKIENKNHEGLMKHPVYILLACAMMMGFVHVPQFSGSVFVTGNSLGADARGICMTACGSDMLVPNVSNNDLDTIVNGALTNGKFSLLSYTF